MNWFSDLLGSVATPPVGRSRRISSNEQPNWRDGNFDMSILLPGETLEFPRLEGPGVINHIWFTSHAGGQGRLNGLTLRIYYDDRAEPGVEVPLADFFCFGDGNIEVVESLPVQVSPTGSLTCYWRMPFARSCRITVTNDNADLRTGLYWQVDWTQLAALPPDTPYFHAKYRQEYPARPGDYLIFEGTGRGRYVGTILTVTYGQDGWFGEGDDFFYIDGEEVPSLQGTGSEDYFNDAWGFRPRTSLHFGQPRCEGYQAGDRTTAYRWHLADPVSFETSLRVTIEHKGNAPDSRDFWFLERPDYLSSIAIWYQVGEPAPFGELPGWPERRVPWRETHLLRQLRACAATGGPAPEVTMHGMFGGRPSLRWAAPPAGATLTIPFACDVSARHAVRLETAAWSGGGGFTAAIDGQPCPHPIALRGDSHRLLNLGCWDLAAGEHHLTLTAAGDGDFQGEFLRLLPLPQPAARERRTFNEAHFYRLNIGRAVYAWRQVNDSLPECLEQLVDAGLLHESNLVDELGTPIRSERRGDGLWAAGAEWEYTWYGLDTRR